MSKNGRVWHCRGFVDLLSLSVMVEQTVGDVCNVDTWQGEAIYVADTVPKRRAEFITTRECARRGLRQLGFPPCPIPVGATREPVWPRAVVGSLTHGADLRAAAVALKSQYRSLGIDVEPNIGLSTEALALAADVPERLALASLASSWPAIAWDRLLFSAKESIFKAWFPMTGHWLSFEECTLSIDPVTARFTGRLHPDGGQRSDFGIDVIEGRWGISGRRLLTVVVVPLQAGKER